jgi:hypothetical protein
VGLVVNFPHVNKLLILCEENPQKPHFDPFISIPGVKNDVNTVNITKITPLFPFQA